MKITAVKSRIDDNAIHENLIVVSGAGRHAQSRYVTVAVHDDQGNVGYGEAATVPVWSGEWGESTKALIDGLFVPGLVGARFDEPGEVLDALDKLTVGVPFAKAAVDCAVWDLAGKRAGTRVAELVADRPVPASLPSRASIGAYSPEQTLRVAKHFYDRGIRCMKFKIGVKKFDDVARLRAVREAFGDKVTFTVDANGAYGSVKESLEAIEALVKFDVALFEQPTHRDRLDLLAQVKKRSPVPVMADESVFTREQLAMAIDMDAMDLLGLYPGKNGGFTRSLEMAKMAQKAGKGCAIGSNLETDLGLAAMATLAGALSAFDVERLPGDFASSLYYDKSSVTEPVRLEGGRIVLATGNGFGVEPVLTEGL
jgi:L-alanine-DL-glutamate epimerase-like enolase superfamily enzyme